MMELITSILVLIVLFLGIIAGPLFLGALFVDQALHKKQIPRVHKLGAFLVAFVVITSAIIFGVYAVQKTVQQCTDQGSYLEFNADGAIRYSKRLNQLHLRCHTKDGTLYKLKPLIDLKVYSG
ncbi:MAG: hypothetical protein AB202_03165 [Parcubacteria bacterium C7867-007]|nr:MAG: hypothetical protein AB202_03165 [Parcubacteria bacterium C7867-007]